MTKRAVAYPNELLSIGQAKLPWYAVRTRSNFEHLTASILSHKGFDHFFPTYSARRRWSDRVKTVEAALFPGYVFCRIDIQKRLPVLTAPGVVSILGIGRTPAIIPEHEIERVKMILQSGLVAEPWPYLTAGTQIRIEQGPLAGCEGILVRTKGQTRLVATVNLLQRAVAVEIERDWATPTGAQSRLQII